MMRVLLAFFICSLCLSAFAQRDTTKTSSGEVVTGEVIIEKEKLIKLPSAEKVYRKSNLLPVQDEPVEINFEVPKPTLEWPKYLAEVPYQTVQKDYPVALFQNYLRLGYGNYQSPLFQAGLFRSLGNWESRMELFYERFGRGPINDENSGNATGKAALSAVYEKNGWNLKPMFAFTQQRYKFYGNTDSPNTGFDNQNPDEGKYRNIDLSFMAKRVSKNLTWSLQPNLSYVAQEIVDSLNVGNKEVGIGVVSELGYRIDEVFSTGLAIEGNSASFEGGLKYDRSLINVQPWMTYKEGNLDATAGFVLSSGKTNTSSQIGLYPRANVTYKVSESWSVQGHVFGGQEWNSLASVLNENPFLDDSLILVNAENKFEIGAGLVGMPAKNLRLETRLKHASINGLPLIVPSQSDSSRFTITYDNEEVDVLTFNSMLSYMPSAVSTYGVEVELNGYSTSEVDKAWHLPTFVLKAYTSHNIKEKVLFSAYVLSMGGIKAPANVDFGYVKLAPFVDAGLSVKYLITSRAFAFIDINNLLNKEYERYLGYPIRGLAFKIGGQYRF